MFGRMSRVYDLTHYRRRMIRPGTTREGCDAVRNPHEAKPMFAEMIDANTPSLVEVRAQFAKQTGRFSAPSPRFKKSSPYLPWAYLRKFLRHGCCVIGDRQPHLHFKNFSRLIRYEPTRIDPPYRENPALPQKDD